MAILLLLVLRENVEGRAQKVGQVRDTEKRGKRDPVARIAN